MSIYKRGSRSRIFVGEKKVQNVNNERKVKKEKKGEMRVKNERGPCEGGGEDDVETVTLTVLL